MWIATGPLKDDLREKTPGRIIKKQATSIWASTLEDYGQANTCQMPSFLLFSRRDDADDHEIYMKSYPTVTGVTEP